MVGEIEFELPTPDLSKYHALLFHLQVRESPGFPSLQRDLQGGADVDRGRHVPRLRPHLHILPDFARRTNHQKAFHQIHLSLSLLHVLYSLISLGFENKRIIELNTILINSLHIDIVNTRLDTAMATITT